MADLIDRWAAIFEMGKAMWAKKRLMELPRIDAVPVVRCRNCIHWNSYMLNNELVTMCEEHVIRVKGDDFCSYGKQKSGDGNEQKVE